MCLKGKALVTRLKLPGIIDAHVHLRDPGAVHKEDFYTGTAAALAGGVVAVLDMPNNPAPTVDAEALAEKNRVAAQKALCDYGFYLGACQDNFVHHRHLARQVPGLKMYLDSTHGPLLIDDLPSMMWHFRKWPGSRPILVHAEGRSAAQAIILALLYKKRLHLCHVSRQAEIELIALAKRRTARITCEVTPHHLFLTGEDARCLGSLGYMRPTLGAAEDREALWRHLDVVDVIASDHAPHTLEEKQSDHVPPGVPGLETALPLLLTAVDRGRLSLQRLVEMCNSAPARIFGLSLGAQTYVEVESEDEYVIQGKDLFTRCRWTPFEGMRVKGRVRTVHLRGAKVYQDGQILAQPGFGQSLFSTTTRRST